MNLDNQIFDILLHIKAGIDKFNRESTEYKAQYPRQVELDIFCNHEPTKVKLIIDLDYMYWTKK